MYCPDYQAFILVLGAISCPKAYSLCPLLNRTDGLIFVKATGRRVKLPYKTGVFIVCLRLIFYP